MAESKSLGEFDVEATPWRTDPKKKVGESQ